MLFRSLGSVCLLLAFLAACVVCTSPPALGEDQPAIVLPQSDWEERIEAALDAEGEWDFFDAPLIEVCRTMQEKLGIDVALDTTALEDFGINPSTPITRDISGISARSFLRLMLNELELTYTMRYGALWITTPESAEAELKTKVYPIGDVLARDPTLGESSLDYDSLIQAITSIVYPDTWDAVGGAGSIEGIYESLVISQTSDIHEEIAELLSTYRKIIACGSVAEGAKHAVYMLGEDETTVAIRRSLDQPITAEFKDASLKDVLDTIAKTANIPIVINTLALEDFGIDTSVPITGKFTDTPLHFVLVRILNEQELTYIIRNEVVEVTTPECCECALSIGLYLVRDLVEIAKALPGDAPGVNFDFDSLIQVISSIIEPDTWDEVGGPGAIEPLLPDPILIIAQTQDVHEKISTLLTSLRKAKKLESPVIVDSNEIIVRSYSLDVSDCTSEEIANLVVRVTEPGTWDDAAGTFVQGLGASLVVKHNSSVHRRVQKLLGDIGARPVQGVICYSGLGGGGSPTGGANGTGAASDAPTVSPAPGSSGGFF